MTITQQLPYFPILNTLGIFTSSPISFDLARSIMNLLSNNNCERFTPALSIFKATYDPSRTFLPRQISPKAPSPSFLTIQQYPSTLRDFYRAELVLIRYIMGVYMRIGAVYSFKKGLQIMFQPHSVRGLLSRRNVSRIQDDPSDLQSNGDLDLQSVVQTKLFIKDIDHQIEDIRQWRDHQRTLFNQQIASNTAVADTMVSSYLGHLQKQEKRDVEEQTKLLSKLRVMEMESQPQEQQNEEGTNLFQHVENSNKLVHQRRYDVENEGADLLAEQAFASEVEGLRGLIMKTRVGPQSDKTVDRDLLKKELEQIDAELRQAEELLKD